MSLVHRSGVEPIDPSLIPLIVSEARVSQCFQVAIATLVLYDTIIRMDKEIKYFWGAPRGSVAYVYFSIRYVAVFTALFYLNWNALDVNLTLSVFCLDLQYIKLDDNYLNRLQVLSGLSFSIHVMITILDILMIRVLALYSQQRTLSLILKSLLTLEVTFKLAVIIYLTVAESVTVGDLGEYGTTCGYDATLPKLWGTIDWVIPLVYALILLLLALYKAAKFWKAAAGFKSLTLVNVLIQDQAIYFFFVLSCSVFNILVFNVDTQSNFAAQILVLLGSPLILSVLGSRMLVNLKEAGERGHNAGTTYKMKTFSNIEFA